MIAADMTSAIVGEQSGATLTHTRGIEPVELRWLALGGAPGLIYTLEPSSDGMRVAERDAVTFAELARGDHQPTPMLRAFGDPSFIVSSDGSIAVGLNAFPDGLCVIDRRRGDVRVIEIAGCPRLYELRWVVDGALVAVADQREGTLLVDLRSGVVRNRFSELLAATSEGVIVLRGNAHHVMVAVEDGRELGRWPSEHLRAFDAPCVISRDLSGFWRVDSTAGAARADVWRCEPGRPPRLAGYFSSDAPIVAAERWGEGLALVSSRCGVVIAWPDSNRETLRFEAREGARGVGALGPFKAAGFSPDGGRCVGLVGHSAVLVDVSSGDAVTFHDGPSSGVEVIARSPSGRLLSVAWRLGDLAVVSADSLDEVWHFEVDDGAVVGCAFSPDERTLYALTPSRLRSWDIATGFERAPVMLERRAQFHFRWRSLHVSADGRCALLFTRRLDNTAAEGWTLLDLSTGLVVADIFDEQRRVGSACFSERGDEVISIETRGQFAAFDMTLVRRDAVTGAVTDRRSVSDEMTGQDLRARLARLDGPVLIERGRALLGAPWNSGGTDQFLRCDFESREASVLEIDRCGLVAEGRRLGVFHASANATTRGARLTLRELTTLREVARVTLAGIFPFGCAALVDGDRTLIVGLRDGRLLRFSVDARS